VRKLEEFNAQERMEIALLDQHVHFLVGEIDTDSIYECIRWITYENLDVKNEKILTLYINSTGGDLYESFALIDVMRNSKIPIKTVGLGQIASCGLLIFLAGTPGRRVLTPNTSILSHQFSWWSEGKAHELFATVKEFELTQRRMLELYKESTQLDEARIKQILLPPQDVYLSAEEALEYNICDHIG
jgi:ATP-dependent Clp protease protease subunit